MIQSVHGGGFPTLGDFDADGDLDIMRVNEEGMNCYDATSGELLWTMLADATAKLGGPTLCADLDGDGLEEALFLKDRILSCVGLNPETKTGEIAWQLELSDMKYSAPIVADVDGKGLLSILVVGSLARPWLARSYLAWIYLASSMAIYCAWYTVRHISRGNLPTVKPALLKHNKSCHQFCA